MPRLIPSFALLALATGRLLSAEPPTFTISNQALHPVDNLIFGQMMERAGRESGPEAGLLPGTHDLQPGVLTLLDGMHIPIIRFPGGSCVDHTVWTDLIDHAPEATEPRKVGNYFGYDEQLRLSERLKCQTILPVNFFNALAKIKSLDDASQSAADLVAYCNAPAGQKLPPGMPDWPAIRAANGHPAPYGVHYFQIGNERCSYYTSVGKKLNLSPADEIAWCLTCTRKYITAMRAIDPTIKIIVDGVSWSDEDNRCSEAIMTDPFIREHADFIAHHLYRPWNFAVVKENGVDVPLADLDHEKLWNGCVGVPFMDADGQSTLAGDPMPGRNIFEMAHRLHWKIALTEWNWNGGGTTDFARSLFMRAIGAAGFLHAIIRAGGDVSLANQSMLIGEHWNIRAIVADPTGATPAYIQPTGELTAFYTRYHGDHEVAVTHANVPVYAQPLTLGQIEPKPKVAVLDALATASPGKLYFHVINRDFKNDLPIVIHLSGFQAKGPATVHLFQGDADATSAGKTAVISDKPVPVEHDTLSLTLPQRSVAILEVDTTDSK